MSDPDTCDCGREVGADNLDERGRCGLCQRRPGGYVSPDAIERNREDYDRVEQHSRHAVISNRSGRHE